MPRIEKTTHELADGLVELAEKLRTAPPFTIKFWVSEPSIASIMILLETKEQAIEVVRALKPMRKSYSENDLDLFFNESDLVKMHFYVSRDKVCRQVAPARPAEWECEPLLSPEEEKELGVENAE